MPDPTDTPPSAPAPQIDTPYLPELEEGSPASNLNMVWSIAGLAALLVVMAAFVLLAGHSRRIRKRTKVQERVYQAVEEMRNKAKLMGGQGRIQPL